MSFQRRLLKTLFIVFFVFILIVCGCSYQQVSNPEEGIWNILNNVSVCILTGSLISGVQSFIAYSNEKQKSILKFYKEAILLEDKIINYPYMRTGFIHSTDGLKDVRSIIWQYQNDFKMASFCINSPTKRDKEINAANVLAANYGNQIRVYKDMENLLIEAIRFEDLSNEELQTRGIDINAETERINGKLQQQEHTIEAAYNDAAQQKERTSCFETLEAYLFP